MSNGLGMLRLSLSAPRKNIARLLRGVLPQTVAKVTGNRQVGRLKTLANVLGLSEPVRIVDIGANPMNYDAPYLPLLKAGLCHVVGFEPQTEALERLNRTKTSAETYFPHVISDGKPATFYDYRSGGLSSLFRLDPDTAGFIDFIGRITELKSQSKTKTRRLDDVEGVGAVDFLKIDVQGAELSVLKNAGNALRDTLAVQTEMRFLPLYENEPPLGQVAVELEEQGFEIHAIEPPARHRINHSQSTQLSPQSARQVLDCDFIYVQKLRQLEKLPDLGLKKLALLADGVFESPDLSFLCIDLLEKRGAAPTGAAKKYCKMLTAEARK